MRDTETLDEILFAQYQLGRAHQRISMVEKRKVGGEITEAKAAIIKLFEQVIGEDEPMFAINDEDPLEVDIMRAARNYYRAGLRQRLQALSNSGKAGE